MPLPYTFTYTRPTAANIDTYMRFVVAGECRGLNEHEEATSDCKFTILHEDVARSVSEGGTDLPPAQLNKDGYAANGGFGRGTDTRGFLSVNQFVTGHIPEDRKIGDADWYRTALVAGTRYRFPTNGVHTFTIADGDGNAISHPYPHLADSPFIPPTSGTYYVIAQTAWTDYNVGGNRCSTSLTDHQANWCPVTYRIELEVLPPD